jgi:hypothetical protein
MQQDVNQAEVNRGCTLSNANSNPGFPKVESRRILRAGDTDREARYRINPSASRVLTNLLAQPHP